MEIRHLRYFLAIAEHGSLSSAAARLFVAQPSLTRQLREIERDIGVTLFARTPRGVSLTEAGRQLVPLAQQAVRAFDRVTGIPGRRAAVQAEAVLRVGVHDVGARSLALVIAALVEQRHPGIRVECAMVSSAGVFDPAGRPRFHAVIARSGLLRHRSDCSFVPISTGIAASAGGEEKHVVVGMYSFARMPGEYAGPFGPPAHVLRDATARIVTALRSLLLPARSAAVVPGAPAGPRRAPGRGPAWPWRRRITRRRP